MTCLTVDGKSLGNVPRRWYFQGNLQPNELLVFRSFDSKAKEGNARGISCSYLLYYKIDSFNGMPSRRFRVSPDAF